MTTTAPLLQCYNKGCGQKFDPAKNAEDSCQHHPGVPVFHDALKGWSCCNKKSTDFSQFLSIPGCAKSFHSNEKPAEPEKPVPKVDESIRQVEIEIYESRKQPELTPRPTIDEPLIELRRTVAPSLVSALEKLSEAIKNMPLDEADSKAVPVGTPCKNASCQKRFESEASNDEKCIYHPGVAIFHEGMKYWSCCQRKTSDFDNFLNQIGCQEGKHLWLKKAGEAEQAANCRFDHHQTGGFVVVTVYSKNPVPEQTTVRANKIKLEIKIAFEGGAKVFSKELDLYGVIKFEECIVNFFSTKVEIKLKKADPINWPKLEFVPPN